MNKYLSILFISLILYSITAQDIKKRRVLVIIDSSIYQTTHSIFFEDLTSIIKIFQSQKKDNGYEVTFQNFNSINIKLMEYGEYNYDHMIILASSQPPTEGLKLKTITSFFDAGKNLFVATDVDSSKFIRQLYNEFGVQVDDFGSYVLDNFKNADRMDHRLIQTTNQEYDFRSFGPQTENPILYRGVGLQQSKFENYQVWGILRGENTTLSYHLTNNEVVSVGKNVMLVAAIQGLNNARAILTGSLEMLSNNFYKKKGYSNRDYINNLLLWNFCENGLLKVANIKHHKLGETETPFNYKIEDEIYYSMEIYRWNSTITEWVPYISGHDIMLEFVMLDPYIRMPLKKVLGSALYEAQFKAPDKYGVFQFKVTYKRPGFTFLQEATKITVRPPKHNEFPRFIQQAYPYYFSTFATIFGLIIFMIFYLFDMDKSELEKKEK